jgi:hypothetical protein
MAMSVRERQDRWRQREREKRLDEEAIAEAEKLPPAWRDDWLKRYERKKAGAAFAKTPSPSVRIRDLTLEECAENWPPNPRDPTPEARTGGGTSKTIRRLARDWRTRGRGDDRTISNHCPCNARSRRRFRSPSASAASVARPRDAHRAYDRALPPRSASHRSQRLVAVGRRPRAPPDAPHAERSRRVRAMFP